MLSTEWLDVDALISLVQDNPELYDSQDRLYMDNRRKNQIWHQIDAKMYLDWKNLSKRNQAATCEYNKLKNLHITTTAIFILINIRSEGVTP